MSKKKIMYNSFKEINLHMFVEIGRIKKPQKLAFITTRMICVLVNQMRDRPVNEDFLSWPSIQHFINQNVNKFTQEVMQMKHKLLSLDFSIDPFLELKDSYF